MIIDKDYSESIRLYLIGFEEKDKENGININLSKL